MGRLSTRTAILATLLWAAVVALPQVAAAGGGFSSLAADATFGEDMTFSASWSGPAPDRVEILLGFGGEERLVVPLPYGGSGPLSYRRDMTADYVPPNTPVAYRWRAIVGSDVTVSPERTLLYDDDRPGLDWQSARIGSATVHWYGDNEDIARSFGELTGDAADRAADLLGHALGGDIDIFVYDARDDFFGAIGTANREWTGAATYPGIRTVFMWLQAGSTSYLETTIAHEVTHVVFLDATANPYHEPASWVNEGTATWSEIQGAETEWDLVRREARSSDGLMAFEALVANFPIDSRGASLAYSQSATMIDWLIEHYGRDTMATMTAAYRDGATEDQAIQAATGESFDTIRSDYFSSLGVTEPSPQVPADLGRSDVALPPQPGAVAGASAEPAPGSGGAQDVAWWLIIGLVIIGVVFVAAVAVRSRRTVGGSGGSGSGPS